MRNLLSILVALLFIPFASNATEAKKEHKDHAEKQTHHEDHYKDAHHKEEAKEDKK